MRRDHAQRPQRPPMPRRAGAQRPGRLRRRPCRCSSTSRLRRLADRSRPTARRGHGQAATGRRAMVIAKPCGSRRSIALVAHRSSSAACSSFRELGRTYLWTRTQDPYRLWPRSGDTEQLVSKWPLFSRRLRAPGHEQGAEAGSAQASLTSKTIRVRRANARCEVSAPRRTTAALESRSRRPTSRARPPL